MSDIDKEQRRAGFEQRYYAWLVEVNKWASKHGITERQALSILYDDERLLVDVQDWIEYYEFIEHYRTAGGTWHE